MTTRSDKGRARERTGSTAATAPGRLPWNTPRLTRLAATRTDNTLGGGSDGTSSLATLS